MTRYIISGNSANIYMYLISEIYKNYFTHHSPISQNILHFGDDKKKTTPGTAPSFQVFQTLGSPDEPLPAAAGRTTKCFCKLGLGWFGKLGRLQNPVATQILHASPPLFLRRVAKDCGVFFLKFIY